MHTVNKVCSRVLWEKKNPNVKWQPEFYYREKRAWILVTIPKAEGCRVFALVPFYSVESVKGWQDWLRALGDITHWDNGEKWAPYLWGGGEGENTTDLCGRTENHQKKKKQQWRCPRTSAGLFWSPDVEQNPGGGWTGPWKDLTSDRPLEILSNA